jgi:hypothetical protein
MTPRAAGTPRRKSDHSAALAVSGRQARHLLTERFPLYPLPLYKASCRTSETLAKLTYGTERFCWRLTTYADDCGRFPSSPAVPRAQGLL